MTFENIVRLLKSKFFWSLKNDNFCKPVDDFVRTMIKHQNEVRFVGRDKHYVILEFHGRVFGFWIANCPYAYLNQIRELEVENNEVYLYRYINEINDVRVSRLTELDFYETFDKPTCKRKEDKCQFLKSVCEEAQKQPEGEK